jgi:hypothetical protein
LDTSQYLHRTVIFSKQGEKVSLVDIHDPEKEALTFEPWLGVVVALADGQHTIQELIDGLAGRYADDPPDNLRQTIESAIERLTETDVVKLHDKPVELPYYLSLPVERINLEQAKQSMEDDGHTPA